MGGADLDIFGYYGTDECGKLKEIRNTHWEDPNLGAKISSSFTALPGGYRGNRGLYYGLAQFAIFWTSYATIVDGFWNRGIFYNQSDIPEEMIVMMGILYDVLRISDPYSDP